MVNRTEASGVGPPLWASSPWPVPKATVPSSEGGSARWLPLWARPARGRAPLERLGLLSAPVVVGRRSAAVSRLGLADNGQADSNRRGTSAAAGVTAAMAPPQEKNRPEAGPHLWRIAKVREDLTIADRCSWLEYTLNIQMIFFRKTVLYLGYVRALRRYEFSEKIERSFAEVQSSSFCRSYA